MSLTFLLLNQNFHPDVMATGQYLTAVALALVERGHQVTVIASRRAYDHPEKTFPRTETWRGIRILRVASTGFGKGTKMTRALDFASFMVACCLRLLFLRRHDAVVALTTPPLISFVGAWWARLRRARFFYWVMDFNPDEAIAAGWLRADSLAARILDAMSRFSLRSATRIIALDRFMRDRILAKGISADKLVVLPPWSLDAHVRFDPAGRETFRKRHGLDGKFVVMYSGNHSPVHPLNTLLEAARRLAPDPGVVFCFIGGGTEWRRIRRDYETGDGGISHQGNEGTEAAGGRGHSGPLSTLNSQLSTNLTCLPYQPLDQLAGSLSAADLHVVVMGDAMLGLVHPCKIYNILSVGAPVLYIGPDPSHVTELLSRVVSSPAASPGSAPSVGSSNLEVQSSSLTPALQPGVSARAAHGDVDAVVSYINALRAGPPQPREPAGSTRRHSPRSRSFRNFCRCLKACETPNNGEPKHDHGLPG